jgi:hypothetical protein
MDTQYLKATPRKLLCVAIVATMVVGAPAPAGAGIGNWFKSFGSAVVSAVKAAVTVTKVVRISVAKVKSDLKATPNDTVVTNGGYQGASDLSLSFCPENKHRSCPVLFF